MSYCKRLTFESNKLYKIDDRFNGERIAISEVECKGTNVFSNAFIAVIIATTKMEWPMYHSE